MVGKLRDLTVNRDGTQNVTVTVDADFTTTFDALKECVVDVDIKKAARGRSKDANAFCWALCADIGRAMTPPESKEDIYRRAIKAVGVCWQTTLPLFSIDDVRRRWESHGTGWFMEVVDDDAPGRKLVQMFFGSSTYTVDEMRVLLEWLTDQARQMEIPIPLSKADEERMLERWGHNVTGNRSD